MFLSPSVSFRKEVAIGLLCGQNFNVTFNYSFSVSVCKL